MKRIISIILILILSLGVLSACELFPTTTTPSNTTTAPSKTYQVEAARDYVRGLYSDLLDNPETKGDFTVIASLMFYGDKYTVDWTVDTDAITVTPSADGLEVTVDVPETVEADLNYKLTGTVLAPDGSSAVLEFDLVVLAPKAEPVLDMMGNTNNVSISTTQAVFQANGVTFTNDKASSTTDVKLYDYAYRAYAGSTVKIEYPGMRKIVITVDDYDGNGKTYMAGFDGMVVEGATIIRKHDVITILFLDGAVDVFQSTNLASQTRIEKIEVFTELTAEDIAMGEAANGGNGGETSEYQAPAADTAFKFFMEVGGVHHYFKVGALDQDRYLLTTTNVAESTDIFFEVVDGGYHIYYMDGESKTYINAVGYKKSNGYLGAHFAIGAEPTCVWTYNETFGILEVAAEFEGLEPDTFFAGTYGSYTTISLSGSYYKAQITSGTQFPARLVLSSEAGNQTHTHNFVDGQCACGEKDPNYVPPQADANALTSLKTGDKVYIVAPAYNMALSADKVSEGSYYNKGVDVSGGFAGLTNAEIWEVTVNDDGSYTFTSLTGSTLALQYSSFNDTGANKSWVLEEVSEGIYKVKNTVRGLYIEWYADKNNWSAYGTANGDLFELSFYAHELAEGGEVTPPAHEHNFVEGKCECGETDPNYQPPSEGGDNEDGVMSIPEVLASAEGTVVKFTGTVHSFYEEWSSYNNCSPYIVDANGNKILVFRTTTKVTIGDVITVEGTVTIYNTTAQIAQGTSKITIDVPHVCSSWTAATCGKDSACVICGAAGADKATGNHTYVDGLCSVCGASAASMKLLGTLSFSSTANRVSQDSSKQVWSANGITLTNNKGASTSNVADYSNPARFYKSSQLIVEATGILKIEFTCNSASYASALKSSITAADGGTVSISGSVVTVTFADPVNSYTIASLTGGQVRVNSITVYVAE